jgi:hypothetical protein
MPYSLLQDNQYFQGTYHLHQGQRANQARSQHGFLLALAFGPEDEYVSWLSLDYTALFHLIQMKQ